MKKLSSIWLMTSLVILPCVLDLERLGCVIFIMANLIGSFLLFKKHNPENIIK